MDLTQLAYASALLSEVLYTCYLLSFYLSSIAAYTMAVSRNLHVTEPKSLNLRRR